LLVIQKNIEISQQIACVQLTPYSLRLSKPPKSGGFTVPVGSLKPTDLGGFRFEKITTRIGGLSVC
jgi:hypothetical protein